MNAAADDYVLQAGFLGDPAPRVDQKVRWVRGDEGIGIHRPPVGEPALGTVTYVADDGGTSTVHRVDLAQPDRNVVMGELAEVVWDIAVVADGSAAYLALVDRRDTERDLGVVRLALDGTGAIEPILPPAELEESGNLRLVAIARFQANIDVSPDGRHLARNVCRGLVGCRSEVIELASGERIHLGEGTVYEIADGLVVHDRCERGECRAEVVELATGASQPVVADIINSTIGRMNGTAVVVTVSLPGQVPVLVATDLRTGEQAELHRGVAGGWLTLAPATGTLWSVPPGWVLVVESRAEEGPGAVMREISRHLLVPLAGGEPIVVDDPAMRVPGPEGIEG